MHSEQKDVPLEGADISGGYFFEFAGTLDGELSYFHSNRGQAVAIKSPDDDVITGEQKDYLASFINDFEDRLYSSDYQDSVLGYRQVVDSNTLASWFVANEYTANPDGYYSTYAYKERGDHHLYWGPMWDYDIALTACLGRTISGNIFVSLYVLYGTKLPRHICHVRKSSGV